MNLTTFNRGKLRKLVEAGKVTMASSYHFDDMSGSDRVHKDLPVAMKPADWRDRKEGVCYLTEWDFKTKSGCAYIHPGQPDLVTLIVHGNSSYELRIAP